MKFKLFLLIVCAIALSGCASYSKNYAQYAAAKAQECAQGPQPLVEFTDSGGQPIKVYQRGSGCNMQPPDNAARIAADFGKSLISDAVKFGIGYVGFTETGKTLRRGYDRAGDQVGGDGFIGDSNEGFTDSTSEPTVVEPTVVEVGGSESSDDAPEGEPSE